MHSFKTAEFYFRSLIDSFDILAISERCLFEEQLGTLTSIEDIDSDRIVGIQCYFPGYDTLYILGVDLPSSSLNTEVYDEYFDYMWALYESLSFRGMALIMGDFNGDLGNSPGDKSKREPNLRGLKLLDLANYFNLCPVSLMKMCTGPLEIFNSYCGRFYSTSYYIFPDLSPKLFTEQYQISENI